MRTLWKQVLGLLFLSFSIPYFCLEQIVLHQRIRMMDFKKKEAIMQEAIRLSIENVKTGGGPFAAIIVMDGKVIASGVNRVTADNDPTAHAEVIAIRNAAKTLNNYDLSGCEIFSTCEPCPMCLGAIYWSHLSHLVYANSKADAENKSTRAITIPISALFIRYHQKGKGRNPL